MTDPKPARTQNTELPSGQELANILAVEAQREVPAGKEGDHYADFSPAVEWLQRYELPADLLEADLSGEPNAEQRIVHDGKDLVEGLVAKVLSAESSQDDVELFNRVYDYLSEQDELEPVDLIFVFGSKTPIRIEKALELYQANLAEQLMISGGNPFYGSDDPLTEADRYKQLAVERGVPEADVITENKSITIPDNVRSSLNLLDKAGIEPSSIILVNSPYTQRRGWIHFKKYLPDEVKLLRVNSGTGEKFQRDQWFRNEDGVRTLANEFFKMKVAVTLNTA